MEHIIKCHNCEGTLKPTSIGVVKAIRTCVHVRPCEKCADEIYDDGVRDGRRIPEKDGE